MITLQLVRDFAKWINELPEGDPLRERRMKDIQNVLYPEGQEAAETERIEQLVEQAKALELEEEMKIILKHQEAAEEPTEEDVEVPELTQEEKAEKKKRRKPAWLFEETASETAAMKKEATGTPLFKHKKEKNGLPPAVAEKMEEFNAESEKERLERLEKFRKMAEKER